MNIVYRPHRFNPGSLDIIEKANAIIAEYAAEDMTMTVRQIYYQFIARDWFPDGWIDEKYNALHGLDPKTKNTIKNYDKLQDLLSIARLAGLVSWLAMEDRTRYLRELTTWDTPQQILDSVAAGYREDLWVGQTYRIEVWIEKDALIGVIEQVCNELRVPFFSCRGYTSQSEQWRAGMRLKGYRGGGQTPVILHFGDHDPSGLDMSRDNEDRLRMFAGGDISFERLALNRAQVDKYNPPPNPTKLTDSRAAGYIAEHGDECWELDALEPRVIRKLIKDRVLKLRDKQAWTEAEDRQETEREILNGIRDNYDTIKSRIASGDL